MRRMSTLALGTLAVVLLAVPAHADMLLLKDGRVIRFAKSRPKGEKAQRRLATTAQKCAAGLRRWLAGAP